jgi:predicted permease
MRHAVRASLVIGQVALALMLVVGAGLMLHSAIRLRRVSPGFGTRDIVVAKIALPRASYPSDTATMLAFDGVANAVGQMRGVQASGLVSLLPIASAGSDCAVQAEGAIKPGDDGVTANVRIASPGLFRALGFRLTSGRAFDASDRAGQSPVTVINASLARRLFGRSTPLGKRLAACDGGTTPRWYTVVGVIADVHANGIAAEAPAEAYFPLAQRAARTMTLVIRSEIPVAQLLPGVRRVVSGVVPSVPLADVSTMDDVMARSLAVPRFTTALLGFLGGTGLLLAMIGIYGVIAFVVVQRTREIGVRIALGATPARVFRAVAFQGLFLATIGIAIGLVASLALARFLARMLFEVPIHDPLVFVGASVALSLIAVAASAVPAWRGSRVDPLVALRSTL